MFDLNKDKITIYGQEFNTEDLMAKLDFRLAEQLEGTIGDEVEVFGKKVKVGQISRKTMNKVAMLYVKAKKDVEGELVDDKFNRTIDIRAASLIMLDGFFGLWQKLFHSIHWRYMYSNNKYNTYLMQGIIKRALNDIEMLFFCSSVESIKSTATARMKVRPQK